MALDVRNRKALQSQQVRYRCLHISFWSPRSELPCDAGLYQKLSTLAPRCSHPERSAGARFSIVSETPNGDGSKQSGGAILTFRYVQAGQRKTSVLYLTPSMVSRFA